MLNSFISLELVLKKRKMFNQLKIRHNLNNLYLNKNQNKMLKFIKKLFLQDIQIKNLVAKNYNKNNKYKKKDKRKKKDYGKNL